MSGRSPGRFWLVTAAALLTVGLTASLGVWQLGRAAQKQALQEGIAAQEGLLPWRTDELLASERPVEQLHRPVQLSGYWVPGARLFLDNRPMNGRAGFVLLSPLRLAGSERAVLVQRGWVARDFIDRRRLPDIPTPAHEVQVQGRLALPPSQLLELGASGQGAIRQNVDLPSLSREWGVPLVEGVSVLQTGGGEAPLQRAWPRFVGDRHKHLGYAAQWFAMCAVTAGLYLWFQIILPRIRRRSHGTDSR